MESQSNKKPLSPWKIWNKYIDFEHLYKEWYHYTSYLHFIDTLEHGINMIHNDPWHYNSDININQTCRKFDSTLQTISYSLYSFAGYDNKNKSYNGSCKVFRQFFF